MDVNSLSSIYETQGLLPARTENRKKASTTVNKDEGDTVSISDEAKSMLARMTASMKDKNASPSASTDTQDSTSDEQGGASAGSGAAGGGSGIGQDSASQIENIEEQIKKLQSQYQSVMKAPGDESIKEAQGAGIQQAIAALEQQLNELKMNAQKKA